MKTVTALELKQKSTTLYIFSMKASELEPLCYVEATTKENQKGLQRVTEPSRLKDIAEYLLKGQNTLLPNSILLNLNSKVRIEKPNKDSKVVNVIFPESQGDFAFVVDGQHRLFSFRNGYRKIPDTMDFELPIVAFMNAEEGLVGEAFVAINVNQKPVNRDLLTQMKAILGLLDTDIEKSCIEIVNFLDENQDSPMKGKILRFPKEKGKWIKTNQLLPVLKVLMSPGGRLYDKNMAERQQILKDYLSAIASVFSDAWQDDKKTNFAITQTASLQIVFSLLTDVMVRCDFYEGFQYNKATMTNQIEPLKELSLLNAWRKTAVDDLLSTEAKRKAFLGQLKEALRPKSPGVNRA
ncbi:MAG TPA: DGQHR domain-containing protein [Paludibacteraceae bacterium]|nr:DGQHR domain-containing protein [Paludibacteraceae bacterium]